MTRALRIGAILLTFVLFTLPAAAQSLDAAKAAGEIGERVDGYVGAVGNASGGIKALVDKVNSERKAQYAKIAKERGISVDAVAMIAGKKLVERTPKGGYVMGANGKWQQK